MAKVTGAQLRELLESARMSADSAEAVRTQEAFFKAILDATVYAHVPVGRAPKDRILFVQFVRPDNGKTILPFFSDREQAAVAAAGKAGIIAMDGRQFFELTRGATLMLNPNCDGVTLYPPEINALLKGSQLGFFTEETLEAEEQVEVCLPSVPTDSLTSALRDLYGREPSVRAGYLVEVHRGADGFDVFLLLTLVVTKGNNERMVQLTTLELSSLSSELELPVTMTCVLPDEPLPELCHHGIQFYGT